MLSQLIDWVAAGCLLFTLASPGVAQEHQDAVGLVKQTLDEAPEKIEEIAAEVDQNRAAQEVSAGILKPIYDLAERLSFPAFQWLAFAAMLAGVVSFALQLTLGKMVVLSKLGFSLTEILSDALGLVVSLVGLVLTTQAATENSTFTASAWSVLSSTVAGAVLGLLFYWWGQRQELQSLEGRKYGPNHSKLGRAVTKHLGKGE